jgi:hypothetical protein
VAAPWQAGPGRRGNGSRAVLYRIATHIELTRPSTRLGAKALRQVTFSSRNAMRLSLPATRQRLRMNRLLAL